MADQPLSRKYAAETVEAAGWRLLYNALAASVPAGSLHDGLTIANTAIEACGAYADTHLRVDVRADRTVFVLHTREAGGVTGVDTDLAAKITAAVLRLGREVTPAPHGTPPVQLVSFMIDALDIAAVRPFWRAVLAYEDGPEDALIDPTGRQPMLLFQQMDAPRPQRNRIHIDVDVPHEEAPRRLEAALAAGGRLVDDRYARAWWVLADAEGNEACICTWQDRD
jgi:4a-hydroxytetrahydrobiopterin dehydratase